MVFVIAFCFFIILFTIYSLAKDDFILLRKNITLEQIFNIAFITGFIFLVSSRLFYILFYPNKKFLNPLAAIMVPYFPGLLTVGGVLGVLLYFLSMMRKKKVPTGRLFDIFSLAFLLILPIGVLLLQVLQIISRKPLSITTICIAIIEIVIFIFLNRLFTKVKWKDSMTGFIILVTLSLLTVINDKLAMKPKIHDIFLREDFIWIGIFFLSTVIFFIHMKSLFKKKK